MKDEYENLIQLEKDRLDDYRRWAEDQIEMHRDQTSKAISAKIEALDKVNKIRAVLRAPRLIQKYQEKFRVLQMAAKVDAKGLEDYND